MADQPLWFAGVCDSLFAKMRGWLATYEQGDVARSRPFLELDGRVVDKPVMYAHKVPFTQAEIDALVRILEAKKPDASLTVDMKVVQRGLRRSRQLPGGQFLATMVFWRDDVAEMVRVLDETKSGKGEVEEIVTGEGSKAGLWKV